ncbi:hypothetical protein SMJ63A_30164 [Stenotrophomonas geniculata]
MRRRATEGLRLSGWGGDDLGQLHETLNRRHILTIGAALDGAAPADDPPGEPRLIPSCCHISRPDRVSR